MKAKCSFIQTPAIKNLCKLAKADALSEEKHSLAQQTLVTKNSGETTEV